MLLKPQMDTNETKAAGEIDTNVNAALWGHSRKRTTLDVCLRWLMFMHGASITAHSLLPSFSTWLPLVAERVNSRRQPTDATETMMSLAYSLFYLLPSAMRMSTGGAISSGRLRSGLLSSSGLVVFAAAAADDPWWRNWLTLLSFGCCCDQTEKTKFKKTRIMKICLF